MIIPGDNRGLRRAKNWSRGQPHQCSNLARTLVPATFFFEPAAWGPNGVGVSSEDGTHRLSAEQFVGDSPLEEDGFETLVPPRDELLLGKSCSQSGCVFQQKLMPGSKVRALTFLQLAKNVSRYAINYLTGRSPTARILTAPGGGVKAKALDQIRDCRLPLKCAYATASGEMGDESDGATVESRRLHGAGGAMAATGQNRSICRPGTVTSLPSLRQRCDDH